MKKKISLLLVAVMLVSLLAGCDSMDYKKAQQLYAQGSFDEAAAIFTQLGDYKDSAQMVTACAEGAAMADFESGNYTAAREAFVALGNDEMVLKCDYAVAVEAYEAGDYITAYGLFVQLGDYGDSASYLYDAGWYALCDYIQANGEVSGDLCLLKQVGNGTVTYLAIYEGNREQLMLYSAKVTDLGFFKGTDSCGLFVNRGSAEATYMLTGDSSTTVNGLTGVVKHEASGTLDIGTITPETVPERTNYSYYCKDIYGNVTERTTPDAVALAGAQNAFGLILAEIPVILEATGLGITMQDLGFVALG